MPLPSPSSASASGICMACRRASTAATSARSCARRAFASPWCSPSSSSACPPSDGSIFATSGPPLMRSARASSTWWHACRRNRSASGWSRGCSTASVWRHRWHVYPWSGSPPTRISCRASTCCSPRRWRAIPSASPSRCSQSTAGCYCMSVQAKNLMTRSPPPSPPWPRHPRRLLALSASTTKANRSAPIWASWRRSPVAASLHRRRPSSPSPSILSAACWTSSKACR